MIRVKMSIEFLYDTMSKGEALKRFRKEMEGYDWKVNCLALDMKVEFELPKDIQNCTWCDISSESECRWDICEEHESLFQLWESAKL